MIDLVTAPRRDSLHWAPDQVSWDYITRWVDTPASVKECGGYVLGTLRKTTVRHAGTTTDCTGYHRTKGAVVSRSAITLDVDSPAPELLEKLPQLAALIHTTFSSTPDEPRYRMVLPASRPLLPDEYVAVVTVLMDRLGAEQFDPGSAEPERYMFRPAAQRAEWFESWVIDGDPVDVDELLTGFEPDLSTLRPARSHHTKRDPYAIEGTVGAFNRVYPGIEEVTSAYDLPYEPAADGLRWQLVGARSIAGVSPVSDGLVYSHHVTDPAFGQTCSSFDLVRLHRFGDLDEATSSTTPVNRRPSHEATLQLASTDPRVVAELVGADFTQEMSDLAGEVLTTDWKLQLRLNARSGKLVDDIFNWDLIRANEPVFAGLYFNEFSLAVETDRDLPWRPIARGGATLTSVDRAALCHFVEREYRLRPQRALMDELVNTTAQQRFVNPVRDYLLGLSWDGVERVETSLPGVRPTPYTRMVARKSLAAAVARVLDPGCKWDHTLVLYGAEGIGKSWWIDRMSRGYSASLGRIGDKDTLLTMQRTWVLISDEGYSLRKADVDMQKEFLTRREDVFRMPYDREAAVHPRHCVIWSTTNDEVFLRRQEGNRRFLIVRCVEKFDFSSLTEHYIDQVWAEAAHLYRTGGAELLYLTGEESQLATAEREEFTEEDALAGLADEYLRTAVPETWGTMSPDARRMWLSTRSDGLVAEGTRSIDRVCSVQLWVEALGNRYGAHTRQDLLQLNTVMKSMAGWTQLPGKHRIANYGKQVVFARTDSNLADQHDTR